MDCPRCKTSLEEKVEKAIDPSTSKPICLFPLMYSRPEVKSYKVYHCNSCGYTGKEKMGN